MNAGNVGRPDDAQCGEDKSRWLTSPVFSSDLPAYDCQKRPEKASWKNNPHTGFHCSKELILLEASALPWPSSCTGTLPTPLAHSRLFCPSSHAPSILWGCNPAAHQLRELRLVFVLSST